MKNSLKVFLFILSVSIVGGCASAQKTAKVEIEPLPTKIRHSDESAEGAYKLGQYFQNTQRPEQALQVYQDVLKLNPDDVKARIAISVLYAKRGDYSTSISQLKDLIEKFPNNASLFNNLGYTYYLSGDYREAASALGKAIVIDPTNVRTLNNMGATLNKLGKTDHALKFIALAKTIKTGKIRPAEEQQISSSNVKPISEMNQQSLVEDTALAQNQVVGDITMEKNSKTEIKQISSGIYEVAKTDMTAEKIVFNAPANEPMPEVKIVAQSSGISFKVDPLLNKLFNENASVITNTSESNNKTFILEIVNGNGVKDFAKKTGETLAEIGLNQPSQITDKKSYNQYKTVLQYRVGFLDEAVKLGKKFNKMPVLAKLNALPYKVDLRLVLGRDVVNTNYNQQSGSEKTNNI